ncbi:MAG: accessory gene regulator B family protein [Peptococcaceae bacterium]|nr:accessory gene regulator B family protein [Peptococcaceae bacterium]
MKMYDIASRLAGFLADRVGLEESKVDTVRFGLEIILGEIVKWVILLIAAGMLGVLPGALYAMISMGLFRLVSGGGHCEDYWRCLAFGLLLFLGGGKVGVYAAPYMSQTVLTKVLIVGCLVMSVAALVWAPGETPNRKINAGERVKFKKLSLVCLAVWTGVTAFLVVPYSIPVATAGLLAMIVQAFSFTPPGYAVIDGFDKTLSRVLGERRCSAHAENT